jgi:DNA polymerase I
VTVAVDRVPSRSWFDPVAGATLHTGRDATDAVVDLLHSQPPGSVRLACDIETPGLNTFTINCITAAWCVDGMTHAVLLEPDAAAQVATLFDMASTVCWHNGAFDIPILWHAGLITAEGIAKSTDTLVLARLAEPDQYVGKSLAACAQRHLGLAELAGGMGIAFKAAGYKTNQAGYEGMSISSPIYRLGAMVDTVVTLALEPVLRERARRWLTDHPFVSFGANDDAAADAMIATQETVNRVMLRRSAVGLAVDREYLAHYSEQVDTARQQAETLLAQHGLAGGAGKAAALVRYLEQRGELPQPWPRTPSKGEPRATKADLDSLDHPLAQAQRLLAESDKVLGYLEKVQRQAEVTGRCHPQCNILGASQTGRASYAIPELHQFSEAARPIITDDGQGLTSIDWSQIEPVTMALMARDTEFLLPFENGADLYEPLMRATGQPRKTAKVVLLAGMYGQGTDKLARTIGHTRESAAQIRRQMMLAMPECAKWMNKVQTVAAQHKKVITAGGRILPVPLDPRDGSVMTYVSVNHVVQGSAYDVLAHTICAMEADGIGDHIQLHMHDEVVIDTEVASHVQQIMETAPEFLNRYAGRSVRLRTDRNDMGSAWAKV